MELVAKSSAAVAVTDELVTLIDWINIESLSGFTVFVENAAGGSGDDIADVQIDTSDDGGITVVLDQGGIYGPPVPITAGTAKKGSGFITTAKFIRIRAVCDSDKDTTSVAFLMADSSVGRICTLADVKDRLGLSGTDNDVLINRIISGLEATFDNETMRQLLLNAVDETLNWTGSGGKRIILPRYPIVSITSIKESVDYDFDNTDALVEDTDYRVKYDDGIIYRINGKWLTQEDGIEIQYRGGFVSAGQTAGEDETPMPNDLREAAIQQASFILKRRNDIGLTAVSSQGGSINSFSAMDLLPLVRQTLDNNKRLIL